MRLVDPDQRVITGLKCSYFVQLPSVTNSVSNYKTLTRHFLCLFQGPSVFCGICEKEGHLKSNCPEELLPDLKQLPPVTKQHLKLLTNVIKAVPGMYLIHTKSPFLSHLLIAGCDIGVQISVRPYVRSSVRSSVNIYVEV